MNEKEVELKTKEIFSFYEPISSNLSQEEIVQLLREIQEVFGCVPLKSQKMVMETFHVGKPVLSTILRLYPSLHSENGPRHQVVICQGPNCREENAKLLAQMKRKYQIDQSGISKDGSISLQTRHCFKHCKEHPNVQIDGQLYSKCTISKLEALLKQ